jgi:hypothetical protein
MTAASATVNPRDIRQQPRGRCGGDRMISQPGLVRACSDGAGRARVPQSYRERVCSFWAVEHLARSGGREAAERAFAHVLGFANDVGLFAEEIEVETGAALGNFPQAFTHVGLINAAMALAATRNDESATG